MRKELIITVSEAGTPRVTGGPWPQIVFRLFIIYCNLLRVDDGQKMINWLGFCSQYFVSRNMIMSRNWNWQVQVPTPKLIQPELNSGQKKVHLFTVVFFSFIAYLNSYVEADLGSNTDIFLCLLLMDTASSLRMSSPLSSCASLLIVMTCLLSPQARPSLNVLDLVLMVNLNPWNKFV